MSRNQHVWHFSCVGGVNRVNLDSGSDLLYLDSLDQKLWTVLSCPVDNLEIDSRTLKLIDVDNDGKIRVPEVLEAVKWITSLINNPEDLIKRPKVLPLSAINTANPEGKMLYAAAQQILKNLRRTDGEELSVAETSDTVAIFAGTGFNGDGIITEDSTDNPELKQLIINIMATAGSLTDLGGKAGISADHLSDFTAMCEAYSGWHQLLEDNRDAILPLGDQTAEAFSLYTDLKPKIDDYFLRCQLAEFDPQSAETLNALSTRIEAINGRDMSSCLSEIAAFPLAKIVAGKPLELHSAVNPVWKEKLGRFSEVISSLLNKNAETISESEWLIVAGKFSDYINWQNNKAGEAVEALGLPAVRAFLNGEMKEQLADLIRRDKELEEESKNVFLVDKLVRYYCDIYTLLNNFVTFSDFYSSDKRGVFQAGTLYFNQRSCDLCIKVSDLAKHTAIAGGSGICLVYFDCFSKVKNVKMTIVAAFTDGDVDNLEVGRNAVFYDHNGLDWDATIVKILDNPISIRQAFWSPYRKISKMIAKQAEKIASSQSEKVNTATTAKINVVSEKTSAGLNQPAKPEETASAAGPAAPAKPAAFDIAKFAGIFAAIGLAFGAIGSALTSIMKGILELAWWQIPLVFVGIMLAVSGPSMILAGLKLRKRNLAPVLDANGWAINARATINIQFGATFTHLAKLPKNSKLDLRDPFTKKRSSLLPILIVLAVAAGVLALWYYGYLTLWGIL